MTPRLLFCSLAVFGGVIFSGAWAELLCERDQPGATIRTYGDALWWALNVCSVGDAGIGPVTAGGRITGAVLIVIGYGCFAVIVGTITAIISRIIRKAEEKLKSRAS
jgi:voltage-gated potassium channel